MHKELHFVKDTANILSFDDARASRSRTRSSRASRHTSSSASRRAPRHGIDAARAEADAWSEARAAAKRAREDDDQPQRKSLFASLTDRLSERKRARTKARADKAFDRQFESHGSDVPQAGPRAALYKGEMGSSQKRASRMQRSGDFASSAKSFARPRDAAGVVSVIMSSRKLAVSLAICACLALTGLFLYEPAQHYYHAVREHDRLAAELAAVESRNAELEDAVAYLQTDSGIEQSARDKLGWVRQGENSVYVQGLEGVTGTDETASTAGSIVPGSIEAPTTWYSPLLDAIFGPE